MKDYNNIVSLWVRGFTMEKENKADLCSVLVKLGQYRTEKGAKYRRV